MVKFSKETLDLDILHIGEKSEVTKLKGVASEQFASEQNYTIEEVQEKIMQPGLVHLFHLILFSPCKGIWEYGAKNKGKKGKVSRLIE